MLTRAKKCKKCKDQFYQCQSSLIVINCQPQLVVYSTKQQTGLVSQQPIKLTGVGETGPKQVEQTYYSINQLHWLLFFLLLLLVLFLVPNYRICSNGTRITYPTLCLKILDASVRPCAQEEIRN